MNIAKILNINEQETRKILREAFNEMYEITTAKEQGKPSSELPWATKLKGKNLMAEIQVEQVVAQMRALNLF